MYISYEFNLLDNVGALAKTNGGGGGERPGRQYPFNMEGCYCKSVCLLHPLDKRRYSMLRGFPLESPWTYTNQHVCINGQTKGFS